MRLDSAFAVELEDRDGVVSPVGGEEEAFIFGETDCGGFRGSLEVGGEGGDRVQRLELAVGVGEGGDEVAEFVDEVRDFAGAVEDQVTRAGPRGDMRGDCLVFVDALDRIKRVKTDCIDAEVDDDQVFAVGRDVCEMRVGTVLTRFVRSVADVLDVAQTFADGAVFIQREDRDRSGKIVCAEKEFSGGIGDDVTAGLAFGGHAVEFGERAVGIDFESRNAGGVADRAGGIEILAVC